VRVAHAHMGVEKWNTKDLGFYFIGWYQSLPKRNNSGPNLKKIYL
jgi:hypothetical protein